MNPNRLAIAVAATLASAFYTPSAARAAAADYEFRLVESDIKKGDGATVAVQLIDKRTGNAVADAVVFATRMDMAPDGMEAMTSPVEAMPSWEAGVYVFKTDLTMAGGWRFSIAAKVQGETETVESKLVFKAVE